MRVRTADVVATLRNKNAGMYETRYLYEKYIEVCRAAGHAGGHFWQFTRALRDLAVPSHRGGRQRWVDLAALKERWPDQDWGESEDLWPSVDAWEE